MNIQSWMIKSWATLEWYLSPHPADLPLFNHVSTKVRDDGGDSGSRNGDTVWLALDGQGPAGLAWEWTEVKPGLVMLSDPNSIITNLQFVDEQRNPVVGLSKAVVVNRLVHALAWQAPICALLQQIGDNPCGKADTAAPARHHTDAGFGASRRPLATHQQTCVQTWASNPAAAAHAQSAELQTPEPLFWSTVAEQPKRAYKRATDRERDPEGPLLTALRRAA